MTEQLTIKELGHRGDGIAYDETGKPIYVPFALPGEMVEVEDRSARRKLSSIVIPSPDRIDPICQHFGLCGGCQMQHLQQNPYHAWKVGILHEALKREEIEGKINPIRH